MGNVTIHELAKIEKRIVPHKKKEKREEKRI